MLLINKELILKYIEEKLLIKLILKYIEEKLLINKEIKFKIYRRKIDY